MWRSHRCGCTGQRNLSAFGKRRQLSYWTTTVSHWNGSSRLNIGTHPWGSAVTAHPPNCTSRPTTSEHLFTFVPVSGSGRKGLDLRPPQIDFSLFPSVGVSFSKTTSGCLQMPRLIEDHREIRIGAGSFG